MRMRLVDADEVARALAKVGAGREAAEALASVPSVYDSSVAAQRLEKMRESAEASGELAAVAALDAVAPLLWPSSRPPVPEGRVGVWELRCFDEASVLSGISSVLEKGRLSPDEESALAEASEIVKMALERQNLA